MVMSINALPAEASVWWPRRSIRFYRDSHPELKSTRRSFPAHYPRHLQATLTRRPPHPSMISQPGCARLRANALSGHWGGFQSVTGEAAPFATRRAELDIPLGEWIRRSRVKQSFSQKALAERAGISRSYLCDIER